MPFYLVRRDGPYSFDFWHRAQTVGPLQSISIAEFLKLSDSVRAIYVGGVLDGMTFTSYGYNIPEHDRFVRCARTLTLGALAQKTVEWIVPIRSFTKVPGLLSRKPSALSAKKAVGISCSQSDSNKKTKSHRPRREPSGTRCLDRQH